jgi:hypothetical protein
MAHLLAVQAEGPLIGCNQYIVVRQYDADLIQIAQPYCQNRPNQLLESMPIIMPQQKMGHKPIWIVNADLTQMRPVLKGKDLARALSPEISSQSPRTDGNGMGREVPLSNCSSPRQSANLNGEGPPQLQTSRRALCVPHACSVLGC